MSLFSANGVDIKSPSTFIKRILEEGSSCDDDKGQLMINLPPKQQKPQDHNDDNNHVNTSLHVYPN
jgi:hypothetical protein